MNFTQTNNNGGDVATTLKVEYADGQSVDWAVTMLPLRTEDVREVHNSLWTRFKALFRLKVLPKKHWIVNYRFNSEIGDIETTALYTKQGEWNQTMRD